MVPTLSKYTSSKKLLIDFEAFLCKLLFCLSRNVIRYLKENAPSRSYLMDLTCFATKKRILRSFSNRETISYTYGNVFLEIKTFKTVKGKLIKTTIC